MHEHSTPLPSRIDRTCEVCGDPFQAWRNDVLAGNARFCGRRCLGVALSRRRGGTGVRVRACVTCGNEITVKPSSTRRFCSKRCYGSAKAGIPRLPRPVLTPNDDGLTVSVPLFRSGGEIAAHAIIDVDDAEYVGRWRWYMDADGYARRDEMVDGKRVRHLLHRDLLGLTPGDGLEGDHINRDRRDNRRENLRVVTKSQQMQNVSSQRRARSKFRGVSWNRTANRWKAVLTVSGVTHHLGLYTTEEEAGAAAREARLRLMPFATD